jgi:RHS repeat-associated protein
LQGTSSFVSTWDAVGNMLDGARTHDANHRLTGDAAKLYAWDLRGNLSVEQDRASGARTAYSGNLKNQLLRVDFYADAQAAAPSRTLQFTYDPLGRRASKSDNGVVQRYVYDGADLIGTLDGAGNVVAATVYSGNIDEPLASATGGSNKYLFSNHLGSVTGVADGATLTQLYRYGPHGQTMPGSSADGSLPFRYTGREKDTDSLYYYRARYYSTSMRTFVSRDPIGLVGGINPYQYAAGDPVDFVDPTGLLVPNVIGAVVGGFSSYMSLANNPCNSTGRRVAGAAVGATLGFFFGYIPAGNYIVAAALNNGLAAGTGNAVGQSIGVDKFSPGQVIGQAAAAAMGAMAGNLLGMSIGPMGLVGEAGRRTADLGSLLGSLGVNTVLPDSGGGLRGLSITDQCECRKR